MLSNLKLKLKDKKGFTLIELVVVIAIMVILLAIVVPNTMGYIRSAKSVSNKAISRSIYMAATQVLADLALDGKSLSGSHNTESISLTVGSAGSPLKSAIYDKKLLSGSDQKVLEMLNNSEIVFDRSNALIKSVAYEGESGIRTVYPES